jgi:transcriptional regulator with XRE-family HTH domain
MDIRQVVAAQLREHRRGRKLTPGVLARRAGVDRALILRLEDGKANPSLVTIGRVAQALNIEPQELLARPRGNRHMQPYPYPRFRLVDRALIQRCRLPEELVVLATSTPDREAIVHLSLLLTEQVRKGAAVRRSGEPAPVRRRKVLSPSDMATLAVNMLMVCFAADMAPPAALARLFVLLHGLEDPAIRDVQDPVVRNQVLSYYAQHPDASLRSASRQTKTPVSTIRNWLSDPEFQAMLRGLQEAHRRGAFQAIW